MKADTLALTDHVSAKDRGEIESTMHNARCWKRPRHPEIRFRQHGYHVAKRSSRTGIASVPGGSWICTAYPGRIEIDAQLRIMDDGMRLSGEFSLKLSTFHIKRVTALGGLISLQDDLKSVFDLFGRPG